MKSIFERFGPTFPGELTDKDGKWYKLGYGGVTFWFGAPEGLEHYTDPDIPLVWPDGTSPLLGRLEVFEQNPKPAALVQVDVDRGTALLPGSMNLCIGDTTVQDILASLGYPEQVHKKEDQGKYMLDALSPTSDVPLGDKGEQGPVGYERHGGGFFYCYFGKGFDLFLNSSGVLKKIILHTNAPGHYEFHKYSKCIFDLKINSSTEPIRVDNGWEALKSKFDPSGSDQPPIVCNRGLDESPNGSTRFRGFDRIIFEVMRSGDIASVTLF